MELRYRYTLIVVGDDAVVPWEANGFPYKNFSRRSTASCPTELTIRKVLAFAEQLLTN